MKSVANCSLITGRLGHISFIFSLADVIDTGHLVAIKGHNTAIDTENFDHVIKMACEIVNILS